MEPVEPLDPALFRRVMGRWPTGVAVLTTRDGADDSGMTVNALLSVALDPPLLLVSLSRDAESTPRVERSGRFAVQLLSAGQRSVSERFAKELPTPQKFLEVPTHPGLGGVPLLDGALAAFECAVRSSFDVADHRLFVGEVEKIHLGPDGPPLIFYHGQYATPDARGRVDLPDART